YLIFINMVAGFAFAWDKWLARAGNRRISEARLFLFALLGGAPGGWLAMYVFNHKTRHKRFIWGLPCIIIFQAGLFAYILIRY
ncbi:MAG: DUF1294 domain-containing protein, partial [Syntrophomonas sp.]|nr:DUF1294 domain-containing protein [Syntrophomonas sp.]